MEPLSLSTQRHRSRPELIRRAQRPRTRPVMESLEPRMLMASDLVGVWREGHQWLIDTDSDSTHEIDRGYGLPGDVAVVGDWDGDGASNLGVVRVVPDTKGSSFLHWLLSTDTSQDPIPDQDILYGVQGDIPVVGDWDGDGNDTIAVVRGIPDANGTVFLHWLRPGDPVRDPNQYEDVIFGVAGDTPVVGDWNGDGKDELSVVRPFRDLSDTTYLAWLIPDDPRANANSYVSHTFGLGGDTPVVGDWDGDGDDDFGVVRRHGNELLQWLLNTDRDPSAERDFRYGFVSDIPVVGSWRLPEVTVDGIFDGQSAAIDFGTATPGQTGPTQTFTVRNDGTATLTLGVPALPAGFTLTEALAASLAPGQADTFTVRLDAGSAGRQSGQVSFATNDGNENPFNFPIAGEVVTSGTPEITVVGISDGQSTPIGFGTATPGQSGATQTFTVRNDGTANLTLGVPALPAGFTLAEGLASSLAPGQSDTFIVRLDAQTVGRKSGQLSFATNDGDENPFNFPITGEVVTSGAPEITVVGISDGQNTPIDFGTATQGQSGATRTFTVRNDGTANLTLGVPTLPAGFTLVEGLASSLAPGQADTFTVRLDTGTIGRKSGQLSFATNDADESPFNFPIAGEVVTVPSTPGEIRGTKWNDSNGNGIRDTGEPGLANWIIYLDANGDSELNNQGGGSGVCDERALERCVRTDAAGNYSFNNLEPGTYVVAEVLQPGWVQTYPRPRNNLLATGVDLKEAWLAGGSFNPDGKADLDLLHGAEKAILAGELLGTPPDSPERRVDPNTTTSPWAGVGSLDVGGGTCTGTVISPRHVLTAAHCLDFDDDGSIDLRPEQVRFILNLGRDRSHTIRASSLAIHPDYTGFASPALNDDVAVVGLSEPVPVGVPVYELSRTFLELGQAVTLVGYGTTGDGVNGPIPGSASFTIKRVGENQADYFQPDDEGNLLPEFFVWDFDGPQERFPLSPLGGPTLGNDVETQIAPGDSGGPSFVFDYGAWKVAGINTFSVTNENGQSDVFNALGGAMLVASYADWIDSAVGLEGSPATPHVVVLGPGQTAEDIDFGNRQTVPGAESAAPTIEQVQFVIQQNSRKSRLAGVSFAPSHAIQAAGAENLNNYELVALGRRPQVIRLKSAEYDAALGTVVLTSAKPLKANQFYQLTIRPSGIEALDGTLLDGNGDGRGGDTFVRRLVHGSSVSATDADGDVFQLKLTQGSMTLVQDDAGRITDLALTNTVGPSSVLSGGIRVQRGDGTIRVGAMTATSAFRSKLPTTFSVQPVSALDRLLELSAGSMGTAFLTRWNDGPGTISGRP
jgi:hypothetical protein